MITQMTEASAAMPPSMQDSIVQMTDFVDKMEALEEALPEVYETAIANYLTDIENERNLIENEYQTTLNNGFKQVYTTVAIASLLAMIILFLYKEEKKNK